MSERALSLEGLELLGTGTTAMVFALDEGRVLKVFREDRDPNKIEQEWTVTRELHALGIPCAQALERVRIGNREGIILERVSNRNLGQAVFEAIKQNDWNAMEKWVEYYVAFAHRLHEIVPPPGRFPDIRDVVAEGIRMNAERAFLKPETAEMILSWLRSMPETNGYLHGDLNPFNVPLPGPDAKMFDVGNVAVGDPLFEFRFLTSPSALHERIHPGFMEARFGFPADVTRKLEETILRKYYASLPDEEYAAVRKKATLIGAIGALSEELGEISPELMERFRQAVHMIITEYMQAL